VADSEPYSLTNSGGVVEIYTPGGFEEAFAHAGRINDGGESGGTDYAAARNLTR